MKLRFCSFLTLALSLVALPPMFAQQGAPLKSQPVPSRLAPNQPPDLTLEVVVTDKEGGLVAGLTQHDFTLLDNKLPSPLTAFWAVDVAAKTPAPNTEIVLVLDAINADPLRMGIQRQGVTKFLLGNGGKLALPTSVVIVSDDPTQARSQTTTDGNILATWLEAHKTGLRTINRSQGNYGIAERFDMSLKAVGSLGAFEAPKPERKLLLWVSPGWPLISSRPGVVTRQDQQHIFELVVVLSTRLMRDHITLYNIETSGIAETTMGQFFNYESYTQGLKSTDPAFPASLSLQVLSVQTGGRVFNKNNNLPEQIAAEITAGAKDASVFYILKFQPARADSVNEYHPLDIKLNRPGLIARTRTGYYAQP